MATESDELLRLAHAVLKPGFAGTRMPDWLAAAIDRGLPAVCYFGHNLQTAEQTAALSAQLHDRGLSLISTDEEGGIVSRLGAYGGSRHVGAAALGVVDDLAVTRQVAAGIGADLREVGIDLDLAPVIDVNSNPANPVIGVRSFGADPARVARHATAYAQGLADRGILSCAKHFPGHGDTAVDSHVGLPRIDVSAEVLHRRELTPVREVVQAGVSMVMTAHILVPAIDPVRPATLSPAAIGLLREEIGFDGVVVTDALDMGAITGTIGFAQGCVQALLAGCDLLGLGNPVLNRPGDTDQEVFGAACAAITEAVRSGELPRRRLEEAAARVSRLAESVRQAPGHHEAGHEVDLRAARASVQARGVAQGVLGDRAVTVLDVRRQRNVAAGRLSSLVTDRLVQRGGVVDHAFEPAGVAEGRATDEAPAARHGERHGRPDVVVTGTPGRDRAETEALREALTEAPDAIVICLGYVPDTAALPEARRVVFTHGDSLPTAQAVTELLR